MTASPATANRATFTGGRGASPLFDTRKGEPQDVNFIFATWLKSYKHSSAFASRIPDKLFFKGHHAVLERLLPRCEVLITTLAGEPNTIIGYAVLEPSVIHFVYVKKPFRQMGVASGLLAHIDPNACIYTHETQMWRHLLLKWPNAQYNPYAL